MESMKKRRNEPPRREFAQLTIPGLDLVTVNDGMYADGYEWYALVTDLDLDPRAVSQLYRDRGDGSHKEALTTRRMLQGCVARISRHGEGRDEAE